MISNGQKVNRHAPSKCFQLEQHLLKTKVTVCWALITLFAYAEFDYCCIDVTFYFVRSIGHSRDYSVLEIF